MRGDIISTDTDNDGDDVMYLFIVSRHSPRSCRRIPQTAPTECRSFAGSSGSL